MEMKIFSEDFLNRFFLLSCSEEHSVKGALKRVHSQYPGSAALLISC